MSGAFGTKFVIVNDTMQYLNSKLFAGGPWLHLATVVRGFKEYICFKDTKTGLVYIEELDTKSPDLFKQIEDANELQDLEGFLLSAGILKEGIGKEYKFGR